MQVGGLLLHKTARNMHFNKQCKASFHTKETTVPLNGTLGSSVRNVQLVGEEAVEALICIVWALVCLYWERDW